jgi:hypothetical protein
MDLRSAVSLKALHLVFWTLIPQKSIMCAVVAGLPPSSLTTLSLNTDSDYMISDVFETQEFASMISSLRHLSVITTTPFSFYVFWSDTVPTYFLRPTAATLTSLTLHPDLFIGMSRISSVYFPSLFFPRLTYLSLELFFFEAANDLEGFIVRHGPTLTHLRLGECPILTTYFAHSVRYQSDIWHHFAESLEKLVGIIVTEEWTREEIERYQPSRYMKGRSLSDAVADIAVEVPDRVREDDAALEIFKSVVDERHRGCVPDDRRNLVALRR